MNVLDYWMRSLEVNSIESAARAISDVSALLKALAQEIGGRSYFPVKK